MRLLLAILLLLPLAQPAPPQITVYGCGAQTCALVTDAATITSDPAPASVEVFPGGERLLIFDAPPAWVAATGPGGEARWPPDDTEPTPQPTPEPAPLVVRQWLTDVWR